MNKPTGKVTFLFTDIEGSTKLSQKFPELFPIAIDKHNSIMRESIESNKGFIFEIIGDGCYAAFEDAYDAVKAACDVQDKLLNEKWDHFKIKTRIGIHNGTAEWNGSRYMGYATLARTQRIMSVAHGGQILISNNVYELAIDRSQDEIRFRDLGMRSLKDLTLPIKIYEINLPGLPSEFPPLKTLDIRPNNLPIQLTSFIGRKEEMKKVKDLLSDTHLITLTGSGGTGKTRLSLQVGAELIDDFENGVWFVELAPLADPKLLPNAIIDTLGVKEGSEILPNSAAGKTEVEKEMKKSLEEILIDHLKEKEILIIFDNCEHLIEDCANLAEKLLSKCAKLKIISTSREALGCIGEQTFRVPSLILPNQNEEISKENLVQYEAVRLFIERALSVDSKFRVDNDNAPALSQICFQLDGIPFAIELAAAFVRVLPLETILEKLNDRFALLTSAKRTSLPRQQTLRALMDWSYELLNDKEKILLKRLSIFSGGWTLEAAEEICSDEMINKKEILNLLINLVDKSLVRVNDLDNSFRYGMLKTTSEYGEEKLSESEKYFLDKKHFYYFFTFVRDSYIKLTGAGQIEWIKKIDHEYVNVKKSLNWSLEKDPEGCLKMKAELCCFWEIQSYFTEAIGFLNTSLEKEIEYEMNLKAKAYCWMGFFLLIHGNVGESESYLNQSYEIFCSINDKPGKGISLYNLGQLAYSKFDFTTSIKLFSESLNIFIDVKDDYQIAQCSLRLGLCCMLKGEITIARERFEESLLTSRHLNNARGISRALQCLAIMENVSNKNSEGAIKLLEESLSIQYRLGDKRGIAISLLILSKLEDDLNNIDKAEQYGEESYKMIKSYGEKRILKNQIIDFANILIKKRNFYKAKNILNEGFLISYELDDKEKIANILGLVAKICLELKEYKKALLYWSKSMAMNIELESKKAKLEENFDNQEIIDDIQSGKDEDAINAENILAEIKSNLEVSEFDKIRDEGETMTLEAVKSVLNVDNEQR